MPFGQRRPLLLVRRHLLGMTRCAYRVLADEYRERRARLIDNITVAISEIGGGRAAAPLVFAASKCQTYSAPDVPHVFRQCSNFRYLTGYDGIDATQLLFDDRRSVLFVDERDANETLWHGKAMDAETIRRISGVEAVLPFSEFERYVASVVRTDTVLSANLSQIKSESHANDQLRTNFETLRQIPKCFDVLPYIDKERWVKSAVEQELMRETCRIGSATMNATIAGASSFTNESALVGLLEFEARRRGAQFLAYPPVVAGGNNANTIHYISARETIRPTDCVLIDVGCDLDGYVSDVTRCFPAAGRFSDAQRLLYEALSHLHEELLHYVDEVRPLRLNQLYLHMLRRMGAILSELHFFAEPLTADELMLECDHLCPHHVSHYLGMDVHDSPTVPRNIPVLEGVVITVEPGIYVRPDNDKVNEEFHGIGFRIEDDILITTTGSENLTTDCVRHSDDIELLMDSSFK